MSRRFRAAEGLKQRLRAGLLRKHPRLERVLRAAWSRIRTRVAAVRGGGDASYQGWLRRHRVTGADAARMRREMEDFPRRPKISVIMPVYNVAPVWLRAAVDSVRRQVYDNWELCIVDDGSTREDTLRLLRAMRHPRIKVRFHRGNRGIASASNTALEMAVGDYVALMDNDDVITPDALFEVARAILSGAPDLIYSDEDKIDGRGRRSKPFFKPGWSPDLLRSQNYICHLTVIKRAAIAAVQGFTEGMDGAQDHDLVLKVTERSDRVHHIPKVLYSWREIASSTASNPDAKPHAADAGRKAVEEHLKRRFGLEGCCRHSPHRFVNDVRYPLDGQPPVSIVIPTRDAVGLLRNCVDSILERSTYGNYEILILDNNSQREETRSFFEAVTSRHPNVRVVGARYPFCWSRLNNHGIAEGRGAVFVFLNNDTLVLTPDWLERLAGQALREEVGAVGPLLLYEDGTIQHAGVVVGLGGWADHLFKGMPAAHAMSPFVSPMVGRNVSAVTGACMAVSREALEAVGGFDERFRVCGSDVAICLAMHERGLLNVYDPFVRLLHYESKTRAGDDIPPCDFDMSRLYYRRYLEKGDPFFNVNLSLTHTTPTIGS